jgi:hypothetical protein
VPFVPIFARFARFARLALTLGRLAPITCFRGEALPARSDRTDSGVGFRVPGFEFRVRSSEAGLIGESWPRTLDGHRGRELARSAEFLLGAIRRLGRAEREPGGPVPGVWRKRSASRLASSSVSRLARRLAPPHRSNCAFRRTRPGQTLPGLRASSVEWGESTLRAHPSSSWFLRPIPGKSESESGRNDYVLRTSLPSCFGWTGIAGISGV